MGVLPDQYLSDTVDYLITAQDVLMDKTGHTMSFMLLTCAYYRAGNLCFGGMSKIFQTPLFTIIPFWEVTLSQNSELS